MSKWTEIRDNIVDTVKVEEVTDEIKQNALATVVNDVLPALENTVDNFCNTLIEQGENESGWCKLRDKAVLPFAVKGAFTLLSYIASKTLEKTRAIA